MPNLRKVKLNKIHIQNIESSPVGTGISAFFKTKTQPEPPNINWLAQL